jgi:hypothetical protein
MKSTKKIISLVLSVVLIVGMLTLTGCTKKEPDELFVNAFNMYHDAIKDNAVVKITENAMNGGSFAIKTETEKDEVKTVIDLTAYTNADENSSSLVFNLNAGETTANVQMSFDKEKITVGTNMIAQTYGIDLKTAKDNFQNSLFGTKGLNAFDLDEESEQEILDALDELAKSMQKESKDVDVYELFMEALRTNATFAADTKTPVKINGKEVKNTTVTATITKSNVKSIVNKLIADLEMQEFVDEMLQTMNENAKAEAEWTDEEAVTYENMNAVVDELFKDKNDDDIVLTIKLALDKKYDAIMVLEVTAKETVTIEFGADPQNITKVVITYPTEEMPIDSTETITKMQKLTLDIKKSSTSLEYKILDEDNDGLVIVVNKAHKEITFATVSKGNVDSDDAYSFKYELTDNMFSFTMEEEGDEWNDPMTLTITVTAKADSPVHHDNYKDLLTLTEDEFVDLFKELAPLMNEFQPGGDTEFTEDGEMEDIENVWDITDEDTNA